jgi:hypothetical protein
MHLLIQVVFILDDGGGGENWIILLVQMSNANL